MNLKSSHISCMGGIFFFTGLILILLSWHFTYPIYMPELNELTFTQFYPSIWPGVILSIIGLFFAGYYSQRKSIKVLCTAVFPLVLFSYAYFFAYIPTSDSGSVKAMFEIFHQTGVGSSVEPYFQFPIYFTLNEVTGQTLGLNAVGLATIFFALFGILIAVYLILFLRSISENHSYQIAFLAVLLYFTGASFYLNYQWVPRTLAFVFFILLLTLFNKTKFEYQLLSMIVFTALVFTHLFIPAIFLLFFGIYSLKEKECRNSFLLMGCIYVAALMYHATFYPPVIIEAFRESTYGFGAEYTASMSQSFMEPVGPVSQILSIINRIRIPLTVLIVSLGFLIIWIKRKMSFSAVALGLAGGIYLGAGLFYPVLGTRSLQVLFIPLVIGIGFYLSKWKKPTLILVVILLLLSVSGPMRETHDAYLFQTAEEEHACNFLANTLQIEQSMQLLIGGINSGYFPRKFDYINIDSNKSSDISTLVPRYLDFYHFFNASIEETTCILYNPNLGREIILYGMKMEEVNNLKQEILLNNKIYDCSKTFIVTGSPDTYKRIIEGVIPSNSAESPIRKYFTTKKILWTFDDYYIQSDHHPPHKGFGGLTEKINGYGGHVNIMVIFTGESETVPFGNEIRIYSVVDEFGWPQEKVNASLEFFNRDKVYPQCHAWNESSVELNTANSSFAHKIINYTLWNWKNNYNITPHFFLGAGTSGNYNITLALKHFSEKYWNVYGESFRWDVPDLFPESSCDAPAVEYIGKADFVAMFDPLFGRGWGTPCKTLEEAQELFNAQSQNKEVLFIRGHPDFLNGTNKRATENLTLWEDWIDWIYQEHNLININHTEAIQYNIDRYNFRVEKNSLYKFTIDLTDCEFNHTVLFTNPYGDPDRRWTLHDENERYIGETPNDMFLELESGIKYYFTTNDDF